MSENYDKRIKEMESLSEKFDSTTKALKKSVSHRESELSDYKFGIWVTIILGALLFIVEAFPLIAVRLLNNENIATTPVILLLLLTAGHIFNLIKDRVEEPETYKDATEKKLLWIVVGTEAVVIIVAVLLIFVTPQTGALSKIALVYLCAGVPVILATLLLWGNRYDGKELKGPHYLLINAVLHIPFYALLLYYIYLAAQ